MSVVSKVFTVEYFMRNTNSYTEFPPVIVTFPCFTIFLSDENNVSQQLHRSLASCALVVVEVVLKSEDVYLMANLICKIVYCIGKYFSKGNNKLIHTVFLVNMFFYLN